MGMFSCTDLLCWGVFVMLAHWSNFISSVVIGVTSHGMLEGLAVGECVHRECNESAMPDSAVALPYILIVDHLQY
jgi:hypothetical protein